MNSDTYQLGELLSLVMHTATSVEDAIRGEGIDFVNCPDEYLKEKCDEMGDAYALTLFSYLKLMRDLQKDRESD